MEIFMKGIQWHNLKNGFEGFEELACCYVSDQFPSFTGWKPTKKTRDGNKDAYTILLGYKPYELSGEQWWMEAKYSQQKEPLSRYRLDATIVSAIISENVTKIIFVTNILVNTKTIVDIRNALKKAINCDDVYFCTRYMLEYWLLQNPQYYKKYFEGQIPIMHELPIFVVEEIECYVSSRKYLSFCEAQKVLYTGQQYTAYFTVFSPHDCDVTIKFSELYKGFTLSGPSTICLKKGIQPICIDFYIPNILDFEGDYIFNGTIFELSNGLKISSKYTLELLEEKRNIIIIENQQSIYKSLLESVIKFNKKTEFKMFCINGISGTGKTYIIDKFYRENMMPCHNTFWVEFTKNGISNDEMILNILLFIMFPYLIPEMIDYDYIQQINAVVPVPPLVKKLIKSRQSPEVLRSVLKESIEHSNYLPTHMDINRRYIIFDDVQRLDELGKQILYRICQECYTKHLPIFMIIIGHPYIFREHIFYQFRKNVKIEMEDCTLSVGETTKILNKICNFKAESIISNLQLVFPTLIELFLFIQYVEDSVSEILTYEQFVFLFNSFKTNNLLEHYIIARFEDAFYNDDACKEICISIYRAINGLYINENELQTGTEKILRKLLRLSLIKYDDIGKAIPYHDLYKKIFRKHYKEGSDFKGGRQENTLEFTHNILATSVNHSEHIKAYLVLQELFKTQKYYSILYVLEEIFEEYDLEELIDRYGQTLFVNIYYMYAMGSTNASDHITGKKVFRNLYERTKLSSNADVESVHLKVTWELCNSAFEHLNHESAWRYCKEIEKISNYLLNQSSSDSTHRPMEYYCAKTIETLTMSECQRVGSMQSYIRVKNEMFKAGYDEECYSFIIRYLQTLYSRNTNKAFALLALYHDIILKNYSEESKLYFWAEYDFLLLSIILKGQNSNINRLEQLLENAKGNYLNDYRKRKLMLCFIYYKLGLWEKGDHTLFSDLSISREKRPRYKAFYFCASALYEAINGNFVQTLSYLDLAQEILEILPDYVAVITHNRELITKRGFSKDRIDFVVNNEFKKDTYLIDPRNGW